MPTGTITRLNLDRGFGFIEPKGQGVIVFFHHSELDDDLPFDEQLRYREVVYDNGRTNRGPAARNIRPAW